MWRKGPKVANPRQPMHPVARRERRSVGPVSDRVLRSVFDAVVDEYRSGPHDPSFFHRGTAANPSRFIAVVGEICRHLPEGGTHLDIGAGDAIIPRMVAKLGAGRVIVVDSEASAGSSGVDLLAGTGIETILATVGVDPVPLPEGSIDVIFAGDVIEHLPHTPRHFMAEVMRLLRPGGWHVQDTPNAVSLFTRLKMLVGISNWPHLDGVWEPEFNVYHHKEYTRAELMSLFERAGLEGIRATTYEQIFRRSLMHLGRMQTMGAHWSEMSQFGSGFNPSQPYEYARVLCLAVSKAFPSLRSSLLVSGQKPLPPAA